MSTLLRCGLAALALAGCADDPASPASPASPELFVVDRGGNAIVRYDAETAELLGMFAAGEAQHVDRPSCVRVGPDGELFVANFRDASVLRYDRASAQMMGVFFQDTNALEEPVELLFHGDQLVVLGNDTNNAVVLDRGGTLVGNFGAPDMLGAHDAAFGPDGLLYVGLPSHIEHGTAIQIWDVDTGAMLRHFGTYDQVASATSIAFGDDMIYVADHERDQIVQFDAISGGPRGVLVDHGLEDPVSLDVGPDGALYIVDRVGIHRFSDGTLSHMIDVADGDIIAPRSITFVAR